MDGIQKSEKITINLGIMELAQIDLLVDNLLYNNRSDFVRLAIRDALEKHKEDLEKLYEQSKAVAFEPDMVTYGGIGIYHLSEKSLLLAQKENKKINIMVLGLLLIEKNISPQLAEETIESLKIYGKIQAPKSIEKILELKRIH